MATDDTLYTITVTREQLDTLGDALGLAIKGLMIRPKNKGLNAFIQGVIELQELADNARIDPDIPF